MIFADREEAGKLLAEDLKDEINKELKPIVVAIPRGGIPVAFVISSELKIPMTVVVVRKLGLPWNKEAGFGSIDPDGSVYLDEDIVRYAKLDDEIIRKIADEELKELRRRERLFVPQGYPKFEGRQVIVVDDGVATGYTAIACAQFVKRRGAKEVIVAVPVCPGDAKAKFKNFADKFVCHYEAKDTLSFAVGMFYRDFSQLSDAEVFEIINKAKEMSLFE